LSGENHVTQIPGVGVCGKTPLRGWAVGVGMHGMMRFLLLVFFCVPVVFGAEEKGFSQSLSKADYKAAGLDKLSDAEREKLDVLVAAQGEAAVAQAAEPARPASIRGKIAGAMSGWSEGTIVTFEDGRRWQVMDKGVYRAAPVRRSPDVELFPLSDGTYIMTVRTVPRRAQVRAVVEPAGETK
jgi:hypothetical protein